MNDIAHCRLPNGSAVKILNVIHSRVRVMFDPAFTLAAGHAEEQHEQERRSPEILQAAATRLRRHRPHLDVTIKVVEGVPKDVIVLEATEWHADRVVWDHTGMAGGSGCAWIDGRRRGGRGALLGTDCEAHAEQRGAGAALTRAGLTAKGPEHPHAWLLRPLAPNRGRARSGYFFFICSPQQISECGIPGGHGQPFS